MRISLLIILFCMFANVIFAIEVAPRISDREIIESLSDLKSSVGENHKAIVRMEKRFDKMDARFDRMDARFDKMDDRFDKMVTREEFKLFGENMSARMDLMDKNMSARMGLMENLLIAVLGGIMGLIAFIIWDRKTAMRPLERKIDALERDLQYDLELQSPQGSKLIRVIHVLRELAQTDPEMASKLKAYSLL